MKTQYKIAKSPWDFHNCHTVLKELNMDEPLSKPTIMAIRGKEVVGLISLTTVKKKPFVKVLAVKVKPGAFIALRLIEKLEKILQFLGVKGYLFAVYKDNERWLKVIERLKVSMYHEDDKMKWYLKRVGEV